MSDTALIVIDIQNDYFPGGKFPQWNAEETLEALEKAVKRAEAANIPVILVQHVADAARGLAPFFNAGTTGVDLHPRIRAAAPHAPVVTKSFADSFHATDLAAVLAPLNVKRLLIGGMMTQNCVAFTAISPAAADYEVAVLSDCCTSVSQMIHLIALNALSTRVSVTTSTEAF